APTGVPLRERGARAWGIWRADRRVEPPDHCASAEMGPGTRPFRGSGDTAGYWSQDMGAHQGDRRKRSWNRSLDVVADEGATPFQRAVTLGEATSLMTNWGTEGIGFINADLTVALARLPRSADFGIEADEHLGADGVAVGTASLFDRDGVFGTGTV